MKTRKNVQCLWKHPELKHFCRYCLHALSIEEILKCHVKDYFKINGKQRIKVPKKVNMLGSNIV